MTKRAFIWDLDGTLLDNGFRWLFLSQLYRRKVGEKK